MKRSINKTVKKVIRIYPSFLFFLLEKWLKKMSSNGWHLVARKNFTYLFEKGKPKEKEYFAWTPTYTGSGKYSIPLRYPNLIDTYGIKKRNSKLNYNSCLNHECIIEIDTTRIDVQHHSGYKELLRDRNRLYWLLFVRNIAVTIFIISVIIALTFFK